MKKNIICLLVMISVVLAMFWLKRPVVKNTVAETNKLPSNGLEMIIPYLGNWNYKEVYDGRWEIRDNSEIIKVIGFINICDYSDDINCISLVPQTYSPTNKLSKYNIGKFIVYETEYKVGKSANPEEVSVIVRNDKAFLFESKDSKDRILVVIQDTDSAYLKEFEKRLGNKEFMTICGDENTQAEMNQCAGKELKNLMVDLDDWINKVGLVRPDPQLTVSQKDWQKYRGDYCSFVSNEWIGGSFQPFVLLTCKSELTYKRIRELESFYNNIMTNNLKLRLYREDEDYTYFLTSERNPVYYRTTEKEKFVNYNEGDTLTFNAKKIKEVNPPQRYMFGVKDYTLPITKEIVGIENVDKIY